MVMKLASARILFPPEGEPQDPSKLLRDEIMLVIADTTIVQAADDPEKMLEEWASA